MLIGCPSLSCVGSRLVETKYPFLDAEGITLEVQRALGTWRLDARSRGIICEPGNILAPLGLVAGAVIGLGGPDEFLSPDRGVGGGGVVPRGRAPEFPGGQLSETQFVDSALNYLGPGYREASPGRYVSADGMRQVRYGADETKVGSVHHGHFEAYDKSYYNGGAVVENTRVVTTP